MIRSANAADFKDIYDIINDASIAYKGVIPEDRWHEPYMSEGELQKQMTEGVRFWCHIDNGVVAGVMGIQEKSDVTLIRHAYVRTSQRNKGIGGKLLHHLSTLTQKPILIGTWAAAAWAIEFYKKHGFKQVPSDDIAPLLKKYWNIPDRQVETSVVLASADWKGW